MRSSAHEIQKTTAREINTCMNWLHTPLFHCALIDLFNLCLISSSLHDLGISHHIAYYFYIFVSYRCDMARSFAIAG